MIGAKEELVRKAGSLLGWLEEREDEMATFLAELVSIPTENPPGKNYGACTDLLEKRLRGFGLDCERAETANQKKDGAESPVSLLAGDGRGERSLHFHGHYDVGPAQSPEQFQPVRKGHFLFGRG